MPTSTEHLRVLRALAEDAGLRRIHLLAWRDLDDPEAGGSEVHADTVATIWAEAGIDVTMRTSAAAGQPAEVVRHGYRVVRRAGRHVVFPRSALAEAFHRQGGRDGLVEIWNGMPFLSPVWCRGPRVVWLHHVHAEMWKMTLPSPLATLGETIERRLAPPLYRRTSVVTLAESSRRELVQDLHLDPARVHVVAPGIDPAFRPGLPSSPTPLVVAVGRLAPVKRFHLLVEALLSLKAAHPGLEAVVVGEGSERGALTAQVAAAGAEGWLRLPGRLPHAEVVELYQRAWLVAATSVREGWGMTLTEAAACGTPAVATRISGHEDAVVDGCTGLLVEPAELAGAVGRLLEDSALRARLGAAALESAGRFTWSATAIGTLQVLADDARRRRAGR